MYNLYIDESCHLEHDGMPVMCIGYTKVKSEAYLEIKSRIKQIKIQFKNPTEIKWNSLSVSRLPLYKSLVDYFFEAEIDFRCILVKYKMRLNHEEFNQGSHDNFYYKLIYHLLTSATNTLDYEYKVYLDLKDTRGKERLTKIEEVLRNKNHGNKAFGFFQNIHSDENVLLQLTDLFIGAITYKNRELVNSENANKAKVQLLEYIELKSGYSLDEGTEPWETKFNIFDHQPKQL